MPAGKTIALGGPQHECQLTGWAAYDLTATSPDEVLNRASSPKAVLIPASMAFCSLADARPPPKMTGNRFGAYKSAYLMGLVPSSFPNCCQTADSQQFIKPARINPGGYVLNPVVTGTKRTLRVEG